MMRSPLYPIPAAAALLMLGWMQPATAEEFLHGRISFADGGGLIRGAADDDWSYATMNTLVLPNDTVWADQEGTVEIELPGGSFLRMADGSKAEFVNMAQGLLVRGWTGSFYVQRVNRSAGDYVFETPAARVTIDGNSQVRVDVVGEGSTTVSVRWGRAIVTTAAQSVPIVVSEGQRIYVDPGLLPSSVVPFDRTVEDSFDVWNRERAKLLAVGYSSVPAQISDSVIGVSDLNNYGEWVYVDNEPLWRPTVVVDYIPYRVGYWSYAPTAGYCWTGDYPFSYITSHYGRWTHHPSYGWCWGYRPGWSGAWVASVRYGSNFVWSPLGFDGYPVYYGGAHFSIGGTNFGIYSSSFCGANDLFLGPTSVYGCRPDIFHGVGHDDIYIWNININTNRIGRDILPNTSLRVRDYSPRRVIRGPDIAGPRLESARTRIASLESSSPRTTFESRARAGSGGREVRTAVASSNRSAEIRTARVRETDLQQTRDAVRRVLRQDQDPDTITGRGSGSGARSVRADLPEISTLRGAGASSASTRTGDRNVTGGDSRGARTSFVPGADDSPSAGSSRVPASAGTRTLAPSDTGRGGSARVPSRSGVTTIGRDSGGDDTGRSVRTRTDSDSDSSRQTPVPTTRGYAGDDSPRGSGRVETRTNTSTPDRTPAPDTRTSIRSNDSPNTRVPDRTSSEPSTTPSPRVERTERIPAPSSRVETRTAVPDRTPSPQRTAPSDRSSSPSTSTPSRRGSRDESRVTVPRQSTPSRQTYSQQITTIPSSPSRSTTSAPRSYSPPVSSPRPSTPSYSPPPSRPIQRSAPSVSAPRSSSPSYSPPSPAPRSAPSVSAPRSSSPSYSTRSSGSSSRSFSAPSSSGRSGGSSPSLGGSNRSAGSSRSGRSR